MAHETRMVREYANEQDFRMDERKLGQAGWSAETTTNPFVKQGLLKTILGMFRRKPASIVVTYNRERPA